MTDPKRIAEIEARVAAATPGPWSAQANSGWIHGGGGVICDIETVEDQDFIAASRTEIPWLLSEVRTLQAERAPTSAWARTLLDVPDAHEPGCPKRTFRVASGDAVRIEDRVCRCIVGRVAGVGVEE